MKKFPTFKPSLVTKEFFPGYKDVSVINHGECFVWAYAAHLLFENVELWDVSCHAFVKYRGRFYDSEVLRGSPDWQDLPATEGSRTTACKYSTEKFKEMWAGNPRRYRTSWRAIEKKAKSILERVRNENAL